MDYFKILNLSKEPFSNSPEPDFFFPSTKHIACLQQLELAIRLRRGLNVVMGEVGTGKTTLCRQLILRFSQSEDDRTGVETHLLLDPSFSNSWEFLSTVAMSFGLPEGDEVKTEWQIKEGIKNYLFQKGVDEGKMVVLIIDEGQKLPEFCREILREFLNYETNEFKLLQIVIFAQNEFKQILKDHENFADRVNQYYFLGPLNFKETRTMIQFRLAKAGKESDSPFLFSFAGMWFIYRATGGYPRKIVTLCHQILLSLIIQNRVKAGWMMVRSTTRRLMPEMIRKERWVAARIFAVLIVVVAGLVLLMPGAWTIPKPDFLGKLTLYNPATPDRPQATAEVVPDKPKPAVTAVPVEKPEVIQKAAAIPEPEKQVAVRPAAAPPPAQKPEVIRKEAAAPSPEKPEVVRTVAATATPAPAPAPTPTPKKPATEVVKPGQSPPEQLGLLHIRRGGTVLRLLREIYGSTETARFMAVVRANPHIRDMNWVLAGETIHFPAIKTIGNPLEQGKTWVQIAQANRLEDAYRLFKDYPADQPPIRLIPAWNPKDGLRFTIVLKESFDSPEAAGAALGRLPPSLAKGAGIMEKPDSDTVYFAK
jgi:general secretion pathway protein A